MTTPAGWYDDPENSTAQRYWDGQNWAPYRQRKDTARTEPEAAPVAPAPPPQTPPPPSGPAGGPNPWEQARPYVNKARDDGPRFRSRQPQQRKVIFAVAGGLAVVVAAMIFLTAAPFGGGGHQVDKSSPSYKMGLDSGTHGNAEMAAFGYFSISEARNMAPVSHQEACEQAYKSDNNPFTRPEGGLDKTDYIAGCMDGLDRNAKSRDASKPNTVVPPSKKGPNGGTIPNRPGS
jgi:hypothetical protein